MFKSWSNRDLSPSQQFPVWRDMLCDAFTHLRPETSGQSAHFEGCIDSQTLSEGLVISNLSSQQQKIYRTASDITHSTDHFLFFNLQKTGHACITQNNSVIHANAGDLYILDTRYPYLIEQFDQQWNSLSLRVPLDLMMNCKIPLSTLINHFESADHFILYENILMLEKIIGKQLNPKINTIVTKTTLDLIKSNFIQFNPKYSEDIFLNNILGYIESNITNPQLRCQDIAKAFHVSERHIYKIFEKEQLSLNQTMTDIRLNMFIANVMQNKINITDAVYQSGFNDLSNFYKVFKRKYNQTPKEYFGHELKENIKI